MLEPPAFIEKIKHIQQLVQNELTFYQAFFDEPHLSVASMYNLLHQLEQEETASDLKKRTIILLRLYVMWYQKNDVHAKGYHMTMFQDLSYEILLLIEHDFHLENRNELFFDIIHSLVEEDFKPIFRHSFPTEDLYEIAYDFLAFSLDYPPRDTKQKNKDKMVDLDIYIIGSGKNARFLLHVYPKGKHRLIYRIDVEWSCPLDEEHISVYIGSDKTKPCPLFSHKKQLLEKYVKPIMVELMFQMEFNREYWGLKLFLAQKLFLEELLKTYKK